jgi:hypothetical protein
LSDEHKTVMLSILATLLAALGIFVVTIIISGGIDITLVKAYVLPLVISSFTLTVFWSVVFARNKGKMPWLETTPPPKDEKASEAPKSAE